MGERRGTKGLELWCRRMTDGYSGVNVVNMTTSWRDGLAFCAIIHHFRPDLIEFSKLNKDDVYYNNELAFTIAERHLGIPALLEPEDMVEFAVPDRLSILTYLSQFYQTFAVAQGSPPSQMAPKRPLQPNATSVNHGIMSSASTTNPQTKIPPSIQDAGGCKIRREPCAKCALPVFIAERLNIGKLLYHRTCFRCARCNSQLTLANYYETENNDFCCETCPDEENDDKKTTKILLNRSLSDEEKSASLTKNFFNDNQTSDNDDDYSAKFETAVEHHPASEFNRSRSFFINSQIVDKGHEISSLSDSNDGEDTTTVSLPKLPNTKPPDKCDLFLITTGNENTTFSSSNNNNNNNNKDLSAHFNNNGFPINNSNVNNIVVDNNVSCLVELEKFNNIVTKDTISTKGDDDDDDDNNKISLVKARMQLFESNFETNKSDDNLNCSNKKPNSNNNNAVPLINNENLQKAEFSSNNNINTIIEDNKIENHHSDDNILNLLIASDSIEKKRTDEEETLMLSDMVPNGDNDKNNAIIITTSFEENNLFMLLDQDKLSTVESSVLLLDDNDIVSKKHEQDQPNIIINNTVDDDDDAIIVGETKSIIINDIDDSTNTASITQSNDKIGGENYPTDLNPFGDDDDEQDTISSSISQKMKSLNPFDDDDDSVITSSPKPATRKKNRTAAALKKPSADTSKKYSSNPFGDDDDDDENKVIILKTSPVLPQPTIRRNHTMIIQKKVIAAPRISLNPFCSDGDDDDDDDEEYANDGDKPVPKPRMSKTTTTAATPGDIINSSVVSELASLSSCSGSLVNTLRKKKPAPKPPTPPSSSSMINNDQDESEHSSLTSSTCHSLPHSPRLTPKLYKMKKAPLPPPMVPRKIIPQQQEEQKQHLVVVSAVGCCDDDNDDDFEEDKIVKDEMNRNRQSQHLIELPSSDIISSNVVGDGTLNKSTYGKWKRRKNQAPTRPIPQRRTLKSSLSIGDVRRELELIEVQQQGLEKQGVRLEQIIREKCEGPDSNIDDLLAPDVEDLVLQLFELVNEKNELFRKQAELMYLRRQQRLEEEHADVEYQIRCLMVQPEANKTDSDKTREEQLINRLVDIVERRNEVIECLEMDRVREAEEDDSINNQLNLYTLKNQEESIILQKKEKKKRKFKWKGHHHQHKIDIDKDVDESETNGKESDNVKKKKKFNLFSKVT